MQSISIIVPIKPGFKSAAIAAIRELSLKIDCYEVFLSEGCAPSRQRNLAAREASGDILYFLDDDSIINPNNLTLCSSVMEDAAVSVAGGPSLTPTTDTWLQKLFGRALASPFGSGPVRNRYQMSGKSRETTDKELILCNLAVRRSDFLKLGGFDERLYPNEENELLVRVRQAGHKLIHLPDMCVYRSQRQSVTAFIRQMFAYGRGRAQQTLLSGEFSFLSFIPMFFLLYLAFPLILVSHVIILIPLYAYLLLTLLFAVIECIRSGTISSLLLVLIYPLMHLVNGAGLLIGLIGGKPMLKDDQGIVVRRIKKLGQDFEAQ
jgi:GT2 family glycosyltransferase